MKKYQRNFLIILTILLGLAYPLIIHAHHSFYCGIKAGNNQSGSSYKRYISESKILKPGCQIAMNGKHAHLMNVNLS
jgi:hypothetical protein